MTNKVFPFIGSLGLALALSSTANASVTFTVKEHPPEGERISGT